MPGIPDHAWQSQTWVLVMSASKLCTSPRCSMKAEVGSMSVDLSPSSRSDASQDQPKKGEKTPVAARIRASFTPNLFSSFEQFDKSLKRVAARADSAHRKRKQLVSTDRPASASIQWNLVINLWTDWLQTFTNCIYEDALGWAWSLFVVGTGSSLLQTMLLIGWRGDL